MPKKNLIEEALIEAQELEKASMENAKDIVLESFTPDFVNFFKDVLNEAEEPDDDDKGDKSDYDEDDEEMDEAYDPDNDGDDDSTAEGDSDNDYFDKDGKKIKKMKKEGNEHDVGKEPDPGRYGTDPAVDDAEEHLKQDDKDKAVKEGKYDDVSGDATPEKGQAGLPKKGQPKTKKVGDVGWEDEGTAGYAADDPEKSPGDLPGKKPAVKKVGKGGWEDEGSSQAATPAKREALKGVPKPPVKMVEGDDAKDDDDEKLDVPSDLFDDDEDITEAEDKKKKDDDVDLEDIDDTDVDIDIEDDDDDKDKTNEGVDIDIEDEDSDEEDDEDANEKVNENLYVRKNGKFKRITPAEYLTTRIDTLERALDESQDAVQELSSQLQETHLFNAKLAHLNKLYMTGAFTNTEKERIAERLDDCDNLNEVKGLYKAIISEVKDSNPLDDFSNLIKENRLQRNTKTEKIYESADVNRMKRIMNYELDFG